MIQPNILSRYKFKTDIIDSEDQGRVIKKTWKRNAGIIYTGKTKELNHIQLLCFNVEYQLGSSSAEHNMQQQVSYVFDDIRLCITNEGRITSIKNLNKIRERWRKERKKLALFNKGFFAEIYIDSLDRLLEDEQKVIEYLLSYDMYGMFLNGALLGNLDFGETYTRNLKNKFWDTEFTEEWREVQNSNEKEKSLFLVRGKSEEENILSEYQGSFIYTFGLLRDGFINIEYNTKQIKHTIIWVG